MNILIVDDYQDNRTAIELLLEDIAGVVIKEAVDGAEAISACRENKFDLVFMDIMMPNVDGIEATKEIKTFSASTMIIALSALDDEKSKNLMLQSGAEDYITKPINSELFVQRVKNYMTILSMRAKPIHTTKAASLFSDTVYPLSKTFTIDSEAALAYFWDYYLNKSTCIAENISDVVRVIYGIGLWLLKTNHTFTINAEENDNTLYLTQTSLASMKEIVIRNIVIKHCQNTPFILKEGTLSFRLNKAAQISQEKPSVGAVEIKVTTQDQVILSKTHFNKITAAEYVESTAIALIDKIESLESIEDRLDASLLDFERESSVRNLQNVSELFLDYVEIIEELVEFEHLAYAIVSLANFLANLEESQLDEKRIKKLITLILSLISDLSSWRVNLFVKQEANDIHYLDSSLLSSCLQIESIFVEEKASEEEDNLEFF